MSPNPYLLSRFATNIPMPTLYAGDSVRKPKLSVIEVLLYNMAALLAGVAAGYDVRMSNVSPVHPTLLSDVPALKAPLRDGEYSQMMGERRYSSNTYHGPGRHNRMFLNAVAYTPPRNDEDSIVVKLSEDRDEICLNNNATTTTVPPHFIGPQLTTPTPHQQQQPSTISTTSGLGSNFTTNTSGLLSSSLGSSSNTQSPTPSPRRKISASSVTENLEYSEQDGGSPTSHAFEGFRLGGGGVGGPPPVYALKDYLRNRPSFSNDGGAYGAGAHRTGYFGSNYFPYRPEMNLGFERDCKSYPDYSYDNNHRLPNYYEYNYEHQAATRTPPPRVPQMGVSATGHRRTPSNISNSSNIIPTGFSLEQDELLPDFYDYNNLKINLPAPTNTDYANHQQYRQHLYRDVSKTGLVVPPPSKHDLYRSSPKLPSLAATPRNADVIILNRMRDYENLPYTGSPIHKTAMYSPLQQKQHQQQQQLQQQQKHQFGSMYAATSATAPATASTTPTHMTPRSPNNRTRSLLMQERPASLPFEQTQFGVGVKLRSSLKKYNFKTPNGSVCATTAISQQGTPTNPTPPDSLTSDDSSYLSAKEGSISSQHSRVRFSPEFFLDASPATERAPSGITGTNIIINTGSTVVTTNSLQTNSNYNNLKPSITTTNHRISRRHTSDMSSSPSPSF